MTQSLHIACPHCDTLNRVPEERLSDGGTCGRCGKALFSSKPVELNAANFEAQTARSDIPVVVDFWAPWCGPCRMMAPAYEKVSQDMQGKARFVKVNTEVEQGLAATYNIRSIPTLAVFAGGREIARQPGAMSAPDLARWVSAALLKA